MTDEQPMPAFDGDDGSDLVPVIEIEALGAEHVPVPIDPPLDPPPVTDDGDTSLLALIDRLTAVLERSDLTELEVEAGGTGLLLRKPIALERAVSVAEPVAIMPAGAPATSPGGERPAQRPSVKAPLTGIFYGAPSPGATPYVSVGDQVSVGQVIGLIEAMKLFNEIKSDLAGRVVRLVAENGALVKAKSPLIEVDPQ
jgi:acetyl-CoA carboxylase biotin carboxyl carrier protein